jgi:hypothetical protein
LLFGALLCTAAPSRAQEVAETIAPDRPGLGDGAHVLGAGVVQVEVGVEVSIGSATDVFTFGQSLVRYGVGGIEIRIVPGSVLIAGDDRGAPDPSVGLKVPLSSGDGPRLSAVLATTLPVGSEAFSAGEASGAATLVAEFTLSDAFGLAFNAGYSFPFEHVGDGAVGVVVTPGLSITSVDGLGLYAGYAGSCGPGDDEHFAEAGLVYARGADIQWDLNWGIEIGSQRWFLGAGFSHRWR